MKNRLVVGAPAVVAIIALAAVLAALAYGGGASPTTLADPGVIVRWGLPIVRMTVDMSLAVTVGALVLATVALSPRLPEWGRALDVAACAAGVLTVAAAATTLFEFADVAGKSFSLSQSFGDELAQFVTGIEIGQLWLTLTIMAAVTTVACFAIRGHVLVGVLTLFAMAMLYPLAQQGHAAGTANHIEAVTALGLHILGAAVWLGGLLTIAFVFGRDRGERTAEIVSRYSMLALLCFIVVAVSGYVSGLLRIGAFSQLATPYGIILLGKVTALVALGILGYLQRQRMIPRIRQATAAGRRAFWSVVLLELAFMGLASGLAAALARTAPPVDQAASAAGATTPAEILTGYALPPAFTLERLFTEWRFDLLWVFICVFGAAFYLAGVRRLKRRGDTWPVHRTVCWLLGLVVLFYISSGGVAVYEEVLFSAHMGAHMVLTMLVPLFLVPGAPVTLALRAIQKRMDGSRGGREWILYIVQSRVAGVLTQPLVAAGLFVGSLWAFYYTPLFRWATSDHLGHEWMMIHFVITGYLFVQTLIGVDPVKHRAPYPFRLLLLLATMAFHAFFGLSIMTTNSLFLADWFGAMGRGWGETPLSDQVLGGGIAWSVGEVPTLVLAIAVAVAWSHSDERESKRRDRDAERTGDADLVAYNAMLERMATSDRD